MSMSQVAYGLILPHPPILVPEVGGKRIKDAEKSRKAYEDAVKRLKTYEFNLIIIITPHGAVSQVAVPIYTSPVFEGDFSNFSAPKPVFSFKGDPEFGIAIVKNYPDKAIRSSETILDHGALVPLSYIARASIKKPILPISVPTLPLRRLFDFGKALAEAAKSMNKKIAVVASADMSHRLTQDAPSGYDKRGKEFDEKLVSLVEKNDIESILDFPKDLAEAAGQDALGSIAMLLGILDQTPMKQEVLSYEGPFGVGHMVATFEPIC